MANDDEQTRVRALGEMLDSLVNQDVTLVGTVVNVHQSGSSMKIRTTDEVTVNVSFNDNLQDMPTGLVQIWGSVVGPNAINANDMWQFGSRDEGESTSSTFDAATYNGAVRAFHEMKDLVHTVDTPSNGMDMY